MPVNASTSPPRRVDDLGDLGGGPLFGALEDEVLEEVRCPAVLFRLDGRAAAQVVAERDRADVGESLDQDRQAGRENGAGNGRGITVHQGRIVWEPGQFSGQPGETAV